MRSTKNLTKAEAQETKRVIENSRDEFGEINQSEVARELGIARSTAKFRINQFEKGAYDQHFTSTGEGMDIPVFEDEDESAESLIARLQKAGQRKKKAAEARNWYEIKVNETKPYGILWFGDPHLGPHCDWDTLLPHIELAKQDGIYGANIGDTTDNWPWTGRLARLWAEADVSNKSERTLAKWFMFESGIKWLVWLLGNHDEWNGGTEFYKMLGATHVPVHDWRAQFTLVHRNGSKTRIDAAHGRKGTSIYNPTHGTLREAKFGEDADLFVTGHIHCFGLFDIEFAEKKTRTWLAQISGYKTLDHYAKVKGFPESQRGSAMLSIVYPDDGSVQCFADVEKGAEFLKWLRS